MVVLCPSDSSNISAGCAGAGKAVRWLAWQPSSVVGGGADLVARRDGGVCVVISKDNSVLECVMNDGFIAARVNSHTVAIHRVCNGVGALSLSSSPYLLAFVDTGSGTKVTSFTIDSSHFVTCTRTDVRVYVSEKKMTDLFPFV